MKICIMTAWNLDSGPFIHASAIVRELIKMGHKVTILSFMKESFHGTAFIGRDEPFVKRCFSTCNAEPNILDIEPIIEDDYDVFMVEDLGMMPMDLLYKVFPVIKRKAVTINMVHDKKPSFKHSYYQFKWDAVVCVDKRFRDFLKKIYPPDTIHIIPHPINALKKGDKARARKKMKLPPDKKILFTFGQRLRFFKEILPAIKRIPKKYPLAVLVVSNKDTGYLKNIKNPEIILHEKRPGLAAIYDYLHASDALILHRQGLGGAVYSSSTFHCLGAGCPIVASDVDLFYPFRKEVFKYRNQAQFRKNIIDIFEETPPYISTMKAAEKLINKNSPELITKQFLELFKSLKK